MIAHPTYNALLVELVATLDSLVRYAPYQEVRESARDRRKELMKLPGQSKELEQLSKPRYRTDYLDTPFG